MAANRIADVTGFPRGTVRRRLKLLAARGWVEQAADGGLAFVVRDGVAPERANRAALDRRRIDRGAGLIAALRSLQ
jgi:hypothetical protein